MLSPLGHPSGFLAFCNQMVAMNCVAETLLSVGIAGLFGSSEQLKEIGTIAAHLTEMENKARVTESDNSVQEGHGHMSGTLTSTYGVQSMPHICLLWVLA